MNRILNYYRTVDLTVEPVTLDEAKAQLRVDHEDEDALIEMYIKAARKRLEGFTGVAMGEITSKAIVQVSSHIELPYQPDATIVSVERYKCPLQTEDVTDKVDVEWQLQGAEGFKQFVVTVPGKYVVEYTSGYAVLPEDLKISILLEVANLYENRGNVMKLSEPAKSYSFTHRRVFAI